LTRENMGYEAVYLEALEVRPERLEDVRRILKLREENHRLSREAFADLLKRELPHLAEAFTPEGVGAFLNAPGAYLDGDDYLHLGSVYNGGTEEEALLLSHFLPEGEVIVVSQEYEPLSGYLVLGEGKVAPLRAALLDDEGRAVWIG